MFFFCLLIPEILTNPLFFKMVRKWSSHNASDAARSDSLVHKGKAKRDLGVLIVLLPLDMTGITIKGGGTRGRGKAAFLDAGQSESGI